MNLLAASSRPCVACAALLFLATAGRGADVFEFRKEAQSDRRLDLALVYKGGGETTPSLELGYAALQISIPNRGFEVESVRVEPALNPGSLPTQITKDPASGRFVLAAKGAISPGETVAHVRIRSLAAGALCSPILKVDADRGGARDPRGVVVQLARDLARWDPS